MTVYQLAGDQQIINNDGNVNIANIDLANSFNSITGGVGVEYVKVTNTSTANVVDFTFVPLDQTYTFNNVASTGTGGQLPTTNATFNVTVTNNEYIVTINNPGSGYTIPFATLKILGSLVGGVDAVNDITLNVIIGGAPLGNPVVQILGVAGTQVWPQGTLPTITLAPNSTDYIQVTKGVVPTGVQFTAFGADGNTIISPIAIVG